MEIENICPVVRIIREIRGSFYKDDADLSDSRLIKIGGNSSLIEFVFDDMSFYMMSRKMELARFELSRPTLAACESKYRTMFKDIVGVDYTALYTRIIDSAFKKKYIYNQFVELINTIGEIEELIGARVDEMGRKGKAINISLPDIILLPHVDQLIIYRPDILTITINQIIGYINKINVNALLAEPISQKVDNVAKFDGKAPVMSTHIEAISPNSAEEYIIGMKKILEQEMEVATYIHEIETYHCKVINHLNIVYDICKKISSGLLTST